jgi:hypothetical protein
LTSAANVVFVKKDMKKAKIVNFFINFFRYC